MNWPCERFMIARVTSIDTGTVTSATSASSGEIQNIIAEHRDHGHQRGEQLAHRLLQRLADVVDVVGDPAEQLAARRAVEVAQRQPVDLVLDVLAHPADGVLHDAVEDVALQPGQQRRGDVDREHEQQHVARRRRSRRPGRARRPSRRACRRGCRRRGRGAPRPPRPGCCRPASWRPNRPAKTRSVAWPRIRGPRTSARRWRRRAAPRAIAVPRSGRSRASSRLADGPKSIAFWPTMPPPIGPRPGPGPWASIRSVALKPACLAGASCGLGAAHAASSAVSWEATISW